MDVVFSLGEWIKLRRRALRLTQHELAALVGCSDVLIRKIEADARRPSVQIATLLGYHLGLRDKEQTAFVHAARADLAPFRLPPPRQPAGHTQQRIVDLLPPLPAPPNALLGRERELDAIANLVGRANVRLVTLVGPPGVGKTRLGLAAAWALHTRFVDGACFIELATVSDPDLVLPAIAQALEVREQPDDSLETVLHRFLRRRHMLLVLDNVEQILGAAPNIARLLAAAPKLAMLATSRAPLRLTSEHVYPVSPLTEPAALELFAARARQAAPDFALGEHNRAIVEMLVRRLDGLPLAIELAAARIPMFDPAALLARLEAHMLQELDDGPGDLPARQRTLDRSLAWSHALLRRAEQVLFRRLGVFVGGWTLEAARTLAHHRTDPQHEPITPGGQAWLPIAIQAAMSSLVETSLVQVSGAGTSARFTFLETLREFARERLIEAGEEDHMRRAHIRYFTGLAERGGAELRGPRQLEWLERLVAEQDNMRAALTWAFGQSQPPGDDRALLGAHLASALSAFWDFTTVSSEARSWLYRALDVVTDAMPALRARLLCSLGYHLTELDENALAIHYLDMSVELFRTLDDRQGLAYALLWRALPTRLRGEYAAMHAALDAAARLFQAIADPYGEAWVYFLRGLSAMDHADYPQAYVLLGEAVERYTACGSLFDVSWVHFNFGQAARFRGDLARAQEHYEECLRMMRQTRSHGLALTVQVGLGHVARSRGNSAEALSIYSECLLALLDRGNRRHSADCLVGVADIATARNNPTQAARLIGAAAGLRERISVPVASSEQPAHDALVAACTAALGPQDFAALWEQGHALSWEQAVTEALRLAHTLA